MVVFKFGGTSVQDVASMSEVLQICSGSMQRGLVLVSSAMAGVTNQLVALTEAIRCGDKDQASQLIEAIEARHRMVAKDISRSVQEQAELGMTPILRDLKTLVKGSFLLGECSPRVADAIWGAGELLATQVLFALAQDRGLAVKLLDARKLIVTDDRFGAASVLWPQTLLAVQRLLVDSGPTLWITQGFIGATEQGVATTLGRGGSDYSAAILGACLDADRIEIWTDVDGIMTTDPRKVPAARSIPQMTYAEAAELAFFGAKVVHPATIQPAVEKGILVLVKNTKNPLHLGTNVTSFAPGNGPRAVAGRKNITLITVTSSRMLMAWGFLKRIFTIFDSFETSVDLVATSEVSVSMTINETSQMGPLLQALEQVGVVRVENDNAILSLVGQNLWKQPSFLEKVFSSLRGIPVLLVSMGSSEINLSLVIKAEQLDEALLRIHRTFFEQSEDPLASA